MPSRKPKGTNGRALNNYRYIAKKLRLSGPAEAQRIEEEALFKLATGIWDAIASDPILCRRYGSLIGERPYKPEKLNKADEQPDLFPLSDDPL